MKSSMPRSAKLLNEFVSAAGPSKPPARPSAIRPAITPLRQQAGAYFTHFSYFAFSFLLPCFFTQLIYLSVNILKSQYFHNFALSLKFT
jgi:hypothetical protein